jgi:hypothetical protein
VLLKAETPLLLSCFADKAPVQRHGEGLAAQKAVYASQRLDNARWPLQTSKRCGKINCLLYASRQGT